MYDVNEGDGSVSVCLILSEIPEDGLECEINVSLVISDGVKAGLFHTMSVAVWFIATMGYEGALSA